MGLVSLGLPRELKEAVAELRLHNRILKKN